MARFSFASLLGGTPAATEPEKSLEETEMEAVAAAIAASHEVAADDSEPDPTDDDLPEEDDEEYMEELAIEYSAMQAERERCLTVMRSPAAARNLDLAAELLAADSLTAERIVSILEKAKGASSFEAAMNAKGNPDLGIGVDGHPGFDAKSAWKKHIDKRNSARK